MRYLVLLYGDETTQNQPGDPGWEAEMAAYAHTVAHVRDGLVEQSGARGP